jgi:hypothetical protein
MAKDRLPQKTLHWIPTGRRKRGTPKTKWKEGILKAMEECSLQGGDWKIDFSEDWVSKDVIRHRTTTYMHTYINILTGNQELCRF